MKKKLLGLGTLLLVLTTVLSACSNYKFKPNIEYTIDDFEMTDQRGDTVTLDSLKGEPWLAMFIFTSCETVCQPMTYNMSEVQKRLIKRGVEDYKIVAFSVDPEVDTPERLSSYLDYFKVPDPSKWYLLTGYSQDYIEQFALNNFKAFVKKPEDDDQVMHGVSFYLVDENGVAVKYYDGYTEEDKGVQYESIAIDMETLIQERLKK